MLIISLSHSPQDRDLYGALFSPAPFIACGLLRQETEPQHMFMHVS